MARKPIAAIFPVSFYQLSRLLAVVVIVSCTTSLVGNHSPSELERVLTSGKLTILSRNGSTTYYEGRSGYTGFEYTLTKAFADKLGVELVIADEEDIGKILELVKLPDYQLGASALTVTQEREQKVTFSDAYMDITQQVLYRRGEKRPQNPLDLIGKNILVIANSAHAEQLRYLKLQYPELTWREQADIEMIDLVGLIDSGVIDHTVVDSNAFTVSRNIYPRAQVAFDISSAQKLAWAFPTNNDSSLYNEAKIFFDEIKSNGKLDEIIEQYYGHTEEMNQGGALLFASRIEARLPKWEAYLQEAAVDIDMEWQLIAAISYQESHWNAAASSRTGVRGLMMLTQTTAKEMGVTNRLDPKQSIEGGSKYFRKIYDRIPKDIQDPDRTWLALAAYNVGYGHMEDARVLTERLNGDPDKWSDVREHLPKLAKRTYYREAKHGYARGWEPVRYVQNIRSYYNVLTLHEQMGGRQFAEAAQAAVGDGDRALHSITLQAKNDTSDLVIKL